jgi:hypothetical protein
MSRRASLLASLAGGIAFAVLAAVALYYANDWWLSGIMTVSILAWLAGVLAAIYGVPDRRPWVVGALIASLLYVVFALGPWFRGNVGPWLVTSQALAHIETKWLGRSPSQPLVPVIQPSWTSYPPGYGSGNPTSTSLLYTMGSTTVLVPSGAALPGRCAEIGHWLFAWVAAGIGGFAAVWMSRRQFNQGPTRDEVAP